MTGFWLAALLAADAAAAASLEFRVAGKVESTLSTEELKAKLKSESVAIHSGFSPGKEKHYEAFRLHDVLTLAFGDRWKSADFSHVAFIAADGYQGMGALANLREDGAYFAFRDLDSASGWEPVGYKKADPGPYFLVWTGGHQDPEHDYPWPWQIAALNLLRFEDEYPAVVPEGASRDSAAYRGFELFRSRCMRCHSMNLEGGKIGPDLNAPQSITAYRSKRMIKAFIRQPSRYRHTQMPDHTDLTDRDLEDLYAYFKFKSRDSGKTW